MIPRKFRLHVLLTLVIFTGITTSHLMAQSASDPLTETPAIVAPEVPAPAPATETPAQHSQPTTEAPAWFVSFLDAISAIPAIGNTLAIIISWMGAISALLTALSSILLALKKTMEKMGKVMPSIDIPLKWIEIIYPYVAWLSMYNVQKKPK
jgi:hypothetical protein